MFLSALTTTNSTTGSQWRPTLFGVFFSSRQLHAPRSTFVKIVFRNGRKMGVRSNRTPPANPAHRTYFLCLSHEPIFKPNLPDRYKGNGVGLLIFGFGVTFFAGEV